VVEEKLKEILGDPDHGFEIRVDVQDRLMQQRKAVADGDRGEDLNDVTTRLGLSGTDVSIRLACLRNT